MFGAFGTMQLGDGQSVVYQTENNGPSDSADGQG